MPRLSFGLCTLRFTALLVYSVFGFHAVFSLSTRISSGICGDAFTSQGGALIRAIQLVGRAELRWLGVASDRQLDRQLDRQSDRQSYRIGYLEGEMTTSTWLGYPGPGH
jgi:hypothetical protein